MHSCLIYFKQLCWTCEEGKLKWFAMYFLALNIAFLLYIEFFVVVIIFCKQGYQHNSTLVVVPYQMLLKKRKHQNWINFFFRVPSLQYFCRCCCFVLLFLYLFLYFHILILLILYIILFRILLLYKTQVVWECEINFYVTK